MIGLDRNDSPLFRLAFRVFAWFLLAAAAFLAYKRWQLGWPAGTWKPVLALAAVGVVALLMEAIAEPPAGSDRS